MDRTDTTMHLDERYRMLLERAPDGIFLADADGDYIEVNRAGCDMLGYAEAELLGMNIRDLVAPEHREEAMSLFTQLGSGMRARTERPLLRKDGTYVWTEIRGWQTPDGYRQAIVRDISERKRTEEARRQSEELLRTAVANAPLLFAVLDHEGVFTLSEGKLLASFGLRPGESVGSSVWERYRDYPDLLEAVRRAFAGEPSNATTRIGDIVFESYFVPSRDSRGEIAGLIGVGIDVTERARASEALRESQERLQAVLSSAPVVFAMADVDGIFTMSEGAGLSALGLKPGEAVGSSVFERYAAFPEILDAVRRAYAGESSTVTSRLGDIVFQSHYGPVRDPGGAIVGALAVGVDVTDRTRALEALRESQQHLRTLVASAPVGLVAVDREGIFTMLEGKVLARLGLKPGEVVGDPFSERYRKYPAVLEAIGGALRGESSTVVTELGGLVFEAYFAPICDDDGQISGAIIVGVDITERKQIEEQFLQAQKMESIGRLAGGVAHDVNNLMTAIIFNAELVLNSLGAGHPAAADVQETRAIAERAANLAHQLLAFSRRELIEPRVLNLNDLIINTDRMLRRLIGEDIELVTLTAPDLGAVRVDPHQFEQVLINLAVNARDAMPRGGRLTIATANAEVSAGETAQDASPPPGSHVMLSVSDTGEGMSEDVQAHLFEPFFTTKEVGRGSGLGLAACYGIVKQAGGDIVVKTEPGRGSRFTIYLPRVGDTGEPLLQEDPAQTGDPPRGSETILVVEDERAVRDVAVRVLSRLGYALLEAHDGGEALRVAAAHRGNIDLLLTDVIMPQMSGKDLADRLAALRPAMRVLFTSGYTGDAMLRHGVDEHEIPYLRKPFSPRELAGRVREALDAPGSPAAR